MWSLLLWRTSELCWYAGTDVRCVTRHSLVRGYYEDISVHTRARNHSDALTAAKRSPTDRTCERTSRRIPPPRTTSARAADASSRSSHTWTSTAVRLAAAPASRLPYSYPLTRTWPPEVALRTTTVADPRWPVADLTTIWHCDLSLYHNCDSTTIRLRRKIDMFIFCLRRVGSRRARYVVVGSQSCRRRIAIETPNPLRRPDLSWILPWVCPYKRGCDLTFNPMRWLVQQVRWLAGHVGHSMCHARRRCPSVSVQSSPYQVHKLVDTVAAPLL